MINECSIVRDILPLYLENMVSEDTAAFVRQHLEKCEDCRKELEVLKSDGNIENISDEHADEDKAALLALKKKMKRKKIATVVVTAVCIIAAVILGIWLYCYIRIDGSEVDLGWMDEFEFTVSYTHSTTGQTLRQYTLDDHQLYKIKNLLENTTYTRRLTDVVELGRCEYIFGKENALYMIVLDNGYIRFGKENYHKINDPDFVEKLFDILNPRR